MATAANPQADLYDRIADALGAHDVHPDKRQMVQAGYVAAGMHEATWEDLAPEVRAEIVKIEATDRQSWDDPSDIPDGAI